MIFFSKADDFFKGDVEKRQRKENEKRYLEKKRQQEIALANQNA